MHHPFEDEEFPDLDDELDELEGRRVEPLRPRWVEEKRFTTPTAYYRDDEPGRRASWEQDLLDQEWNEWIQATPLSAADLTDLPPGQRYRVSKEDMT